MDDKCNIFAGNTFWLTFVSIDDSLREYNIDFYPKKIIKTKIVWITRKSDVYMAQSIHSQIKITSNTKNYKKQNTHFTDERTIPIFLYKRLQIQSSIPFSQS